MKRVFVVQQPAKLIGGEWRPIFDINPAKVFGKLNFVLLRPGNIFLDALPNVFAHMRNVLKDFDDGDFILPTGEPIAIAATCIIAAVANNGRIKILKWDRIEKNYQIVQINAPRG